MVFSFALSFWPWDQGSLVCGHTVGGYSGCGTAITFRSAIDWPSLDSLRGSLALWGKQLAGARG